MNQTARPARGLQGDAFGKVDRRRPGGEADEADRNDRREGIGECEQRERTGIQINTSVGQERMKEVVARL